MVHLRYAFAFGFSLIIFPDHRFDCPMTPNRKLCWPEVRLWEVGRFTGSCRRLRPDDVSVISGLQPAKSNENVSDARTRENGNYEGLARAFVRAAIRDVFGPNSPRVQRTTYASRRKRTASSGPASCPPRLPADQRSPLLQGGSVSRRKLSQFRG